MKTRDPSPSVHVHVPETTAVHVHRRSPKSLQMREPHVTEARESHRSPDRLKARSPWIPPGKVSSRRNVGAYKWQEGGERYGCCEKRGRKLDRLMMEVDSPTTESTMRTKERRHQQGAEEQKVEVVVISENPNDREQENDRRLPPRAASGDRTRKTDVLLRALVETELDGMAISNQLAAFTQTIDCLTKEKRLSKRDTASLGRQQESVLERIELFDASNRNLRELLREWQQHEKESLVASGQDEWLRKRLVDAEAENIQLTAKLTNKEKEASKLAEDLDFEKDNVKTTEELSRILESTREYLQSQLLKKEVENGNLATQIQRMQEKHERQREALKALQEEVLMQRKERQDLGTVTLLTQQADRAEESVRQLSAQLQEKESQLAQALSTSSDWCSRHSQEVSAKERLEEEVAAVRRRLMETNTQLQTSGERLRVEREELKDQLHLLNAENASTKLDNQRLKASLTSSEEMLKELQTEALQFKTSIRKQKSMVEMYKMKAEQARLESEEYSVKLSTTQREARELKGSLERELDQVRRELLCRLRELEPLPEKLRRTERQLREAQGEADAQGRRSTEQSAALSDVRHKVEQQGDQLEKIQQQNLLKQEENNVLREKIQTLERKLEEVTLENEDRAQVLSVKEATIRSFQLQLEERSSECSVLSRQLDLTLEESRRQVDESMQRALCKEKASQSKALDLESQLSMAKAQLAQLHRSKEEMERRLQNQLKSTKDRLEQSDSTNRSLQNYVQFLKASYGNVFGDSFPAS
ncbi:outer dense fiber protein 2-like [Lampris incognitus]|uniref:outer dense fiber protein 2-like n=1 Tax=Lampris incognitus TaxID=2546036 RepID=UPI0024B63357|nr:outer dense fiber protein 2-like [Lampris incognitus]